MTDDQIIQAAMGILDRRMQEKLQPIGAAGEAVQKIALELADERVEHLVCVWLDGCNRVITTQHMGQGGIDVMSFVPRELARAAVLNDATYAVLVHNHPDGNPAPSEQDRLATGRMQHCLATVGVAMTGSFVVGGTKAHCCITDRAFDLATTGEEDETIDQSNDQSNQAFVDRLGAIETAFVNGEVEAFRQAVIECLSHANPEQAEGFMRAIWGGEPGIIDFVGPDEEGGVFVVSGGQVMTEAEYERNHALLGLEPEGGMQ